MKSVAELMEKWNERMVEGNRIAKEVEDGKKAIEQCAEMEVALVKNGECKYLDGLLTEKERAVLKELVEKLLESHLSEKISKLEHLINPGQKVDVRAKEEVTEGKEETKEKSIAESVKELYVNQKKTMKEVASELHISSTTVGNICKENGWTRPNPCIQKKTMSDEEFKDMYINKKMTLDAIAKETGYTKGSLYNIKSRLQLSTPSKGGK